MIHTTIFFAALWRLRPYFFFLINVNKCFVKNLISGWDTNIPLCAILIGADSFVTIFLRESTPDILHLYILKSSGHWTMSLFIVNLKYGVFIKSKDPIAAAPRLCNAESAHVISSSFKTETTVVKLTVAFLESSIKNNDWSREELIMEHKTTRSFSWIVTFGGRACIWMSWVKAETIDRVQMI